MKDDLLGELNLLRDVFVSNGFPHKLVNRTINESRISERKKWAAENFEQRDMTTMNILNNEMTAMNILQSYMHLMFRVSQKDSRKSSKHLGLDL